MAGRQGEHAGQRVGGLAEPDFSDALESSAQFPPREGVQVPVIALFAGFLVLDEQVTWRVLLASLLILGGVAITLRSRRPVDA